MSWQHSSWRSDVFEDSFAIQEARFVQVHGDRRVLEERLVIDFRPRLQLAELTSLVLLYFLHSLCCIGRAVRRLVETQRISSLVE